MKKQDGFKIKKIKRLKKYLPVSSVDKSNTGKRCVVVKLPIFWESLTTICLMAQILLILVYVAAIITHLVDSRLSRLEVSPRIITATALDVLYV
jgi:hypothetical protein